MPTGIGNPYNGGQSPLEYYAINGNVSVNGGLGRPVLLNQTTLYYGQSFKNPQITGNANDKYQTTHTNALADATTPLRGKGTNQAYDATNSFNGFAVRSNYAGGDDFDIIGGGLAPGGNSLVGNGLGRNSSILINAGSWGYGPSAVAGSNYAAPTMTANIGQVTI